MSDVTPSDSSRNAPALPADIAEQYPFAPHYMSLPDGQRMHYIDEGQGPVILMLHGNPTWSFMYRNLVRALSPHFRCIVPDHIGCGLSDKPQKYAYTLSKHIENVAALLDGLGINNFNLIAHDWGGAIGSGIAGRRPEQVGRIMLMNTAAFRSMRIPFRIATCKLPLFGSILVRGFNAFAACAVKMAVERPMAADVKRGYVYPYGNWHDRIATLRFVQDVPLHRAHVSYAELARVEDSLASLVGKPMLICWGMHDWCFSPPFLAQWQRLFPAARVECFADAGHYLVEDEKEKICVLAQEFFKQS